MLGYIFGLPILIHWSIYLFFLFGFYFFKLIYFNWRLFTLQYCGFCHTSTCISHGCTRVPPSWPPFHLPPHPIPLGCPRALVFSALLLALNLHWSSILRMVIYMFQCYSTIFLLLCPYTVLMDMEQQTGSKSGKKYIKAIYCTLLI